MSRAPVIAASLLVACSAPSPLDAVGREAPPLDPQDLPANIDRIATTTLATTGVPSAVVVAVRDAKIVYAHAYGNARLAPPTPATTAMRYSIGSISKQFTAAALLLLAEDGKLSLDDAVSKFVPGLTRGDEVTLRQLLSHTSGYPDYAPQDYMIPAWTQPIAATAILDQWAKQPLEFEPGTRSQYSNTNFVIAGLVCDKVTGVPLFDFLTARIFKKLGMTSVTNSDLAKLVEPDAEGYFRRALGPLHPAPHEGPGWMYAAGELAMTAQDLARWDIAVMTGELLSPASYRELETDVRLANGAATSYGLGLGVDLVQGHRVLRHTGEVSGFVAANTVMPDDGLAVVVLTNQDASGAASVIAGKVRTALLASITPANADADRVVRAVLDGLTTRQLDRGKLTANANAYFTAEAIDEYAQTLAPLGPLQRLEQTSSGKRGGMIQRRYRAMYAGKSLALNVYESRSGTLDQFLLDAE